MTLPGGHTPDIHSFLGHAGFYRRFIKDFSKTSRPLTNLLQKDIPFVFDEDCVGTSLWHGNKLIQGDLK